MGEKEQLLILSFDSAAKIGIPNKADKIHQPHFPVNQNVNGYLWSHVMILHNDI